MTFWKLFTGSAIILAFSFSLAAGIQQEASSDDTSAQKASGDAAKGKQVFETNCQLCHNADSEEALVGPGLKGLFKWPPHKLSDGTEHTEHTVEIIRNQITQGGGAMAPMGDMLSAEDLDNLIAYLQTL
jgi:mono/diheme cytochrome c family protein